MNNGSHSFRPTTTYKRESLINNQSTFGIYELNSNAEELKFDKYLIANGLITRPGFDETDGLDIGIFRGKRKLLMDKISQMRLKRLKHAAGNFPPQLKPVDSQQRHQWMKDLAGSISLQALSNSLPMNSGSVGDVIEQLWLYRVAYIRALWYLRASYLGRKAAASQATSRRREKEWDWTDDICKYISQLIGANNRNQTPNTATVLKSKPKSSNRLQRTPNTRPSPTTPNFEYLFSSSDWYHKWNYVSTLIIYQFHEGMIERHKFIHYLLQSLRDTLQLNSVDIILRIVGIYLFIIVNILPYLVLWQPDVISLSNILIKLCKKSKDQFTIPLEKCISHIIEYVLEVAKFNNKSYLELIQLLPHRCNVIKKISETHNKDIIRLIENGFSYITWLDFSSARGVKMNKLEWPAPLEELQNLIINTSLTESENNNAIVININVLFIILEWTCHHSNLIPAIVYFITKVLWNISNDKIQDTLTHFLFKFKPATINEVRNVGQLFYLLVINNMFSFDEFVKTSSRMRYINRKIYNHTPSQLTDNDINSPLAFYMENIKTHNCIKGESSTRHSLKLRNALETRLYKLSHLFAIHRLHHLSNGKFLNKAWKKACEHFGCQNMSIHNSIHLNKKDVKNFPDFNTITSIDTNIRTLVEHITLSQSHALLKWLCDRLVDNSNNDNIDDYSYFCVTREILEALESQLHLQNLLLSTIIKLLRCRKNIHSILSRIISSKFVAFLMMYRYQQLHKECASIMRSLATQNDAQQWLERLGLPNVMKRSLMNKVLNSWLQKDTKLLHKSNYSKDVCTIEEFNYTLSKIFNDEHFQKINRQLLSMPSRKETFKHCISQILRQTILLAVSDQVDNRMLWNYYNKLMFVLEIYISNTNRSLNPLNEICEIIYQLVCNLHLIQKDKTKFSNLYELHIVSTFHPLACERTLLIIIGMVIRNVCSWNMICHKLKSVIANPLNIFESNANSIIILCILLSGSIPRLSTPSKSIGIIDCQKLENIWPKQEEELLKTIIPQQHIILLFSIFKDICDFIQNNLKVKNLSDNWCIFCSWLLHASIFESNSSVISWIQFNWSNGNRSEVVSLYKTKLTPTFAYLIHFYVNDQIINSNQKVAPDYSLDTIAQKVKDIEHNNKLMDGLLKSLNDWNIQYSWLNIELLLNINRQQLDNTNRQQVNDADLLAEIILDVSWEQNSISQPEPSNSIILIELVRNLSANVIKPLWKKLAKRLNDHMTQVLQMFKKYSSISAMNNQVKDNKKLEGEDVCNWLVNEAQMFESNKIKRMLKCNLVLVFEALAESNALEQSKRAEIVDMLLKFLCDMSIFIRQSKLFLSIISLRELFINNFQTIWDCMWPFKNLLAIDITRRAKSYVYMIIDLLFSDRPLIMTLEHKLYSRFGDIIDELENVKLKDSTQKQAIDNLYFDINTRLLKSHEIALTTRFNIARYIPLRWPGFDELDAVVVTVNNTHSAHKSVKCWDLIESYPNPFCTIIYDNSEVFENN